MRAGRVGFGLYCMASPPLYGIKMQIAVYACGGEPPGGIGFPGTRMARGYPTLPGSSQPAKANAAMYRGRVTFFPTLPTLTLPSL